MKQHKIELGGILFDDIGMIDAAKAILLAAKNGTGGFMVTPNAAITHNAMTDDSFAALLRRAFLTLPDGVGITAAARLLHTPFAHGRVPGVELGEVVIRLAAKAGLSVFFLGGKPGVAQKAAMLLKNRYPSLIVAGTKHGYGIKPESVAKTIRKSGAKIVFCCLGSPLQEKFAEQLSKTLPAPILCLGGSLDIYAENKKRAPYFVRKLCCEWLWRTLAEPARAERLPSLFLFFTDILAEKYKKHLQYPYEKGIIKDNDRTAGLVRARLSNFSKRG